MANDLTRKIMANIAAKTIPVNTNTGTYANISAGDEAALTDVIYGGRKPAATAAKGARPASAARTAGGAITLAALAQQKRHS